MTEKGKGKLRVVMSHGSAMGKTEVVKAYVADWMNKAKVGESMVILKRKQDPVIITRNSNQLEDKRDEQEP